MNTKHIVCPNCNGVNRVPEERISDGALCGKCRNRLFNGQPLVLNSRNFEKHFERNDIPLVIDFWAPWCGPCKMMGPVFSQAVDRLEPRVRMAKVNTEEEKGLAQRFSIRSIPTLAIFKQGREIARQPGAIDQSTLLNWVQANLLNP